MLVQFDRSALAAAAVPPQQPYEGVYVREAETVRRGERPVFKRDAGLSNQVAAAAAAVATTAAAAAAAATAPERLYLFYAKKYEAWCIGPSLSPLAPVVLARRR